MTVALMTIPLLILAAFTLDFGMTYAQARAFSSGADSAALAIVNAKRSMINAQPTVPTNCRTIVDNDAGASLTLAKAQVDKNGPFGLDTTSGNISVSINLQCLDKNGNADDNGMLKATVRVQRDVPTSLARMVGVSSVHADKDGSAALGVARQVSGVFPLAICKAEADDIAHNASLANAAGLPYPIETIEVDKVWNADCSAGGNGSGNWGWLNCGDGLSATDIGSYISNGCKADLTLTGTPPSLTVNGAPGNKINSGNVAGPLSAVLGKTYAFPVYDKISGNGANTNYNIVGFIQLKLISYDGDGNIKVQYVSYSPVGDVNNLCGIGNIQCTAYNAWATGLVN